MTQQEIDARAARAKEYFKQGFNCSQAVVLACCDIFNIDERTALLASASFGGGIGRMRQTCGAMCGVALLEGFRTGSTQPDIEQKKRNYEQVQYLAEQFKKKHGSTICAELLGLAKGSETHQKTPCADIVENAVKIFLKNANTL